MNEEIDLANATPRRPALAPRRALFLALLVAYLFVLAGLIALSVAQHSHA